MLHRDRILVLVAAIALVWLQALLASGCASAHGEASFEMQIVQAKVAVAEVQSRLYTNEPDKRPVPGQDTDIDQAYETMRDAFDEAHASLGDLREALSKVEEETREAKQLAVEAMVKTRAELDSTRKDRDKARKELRQTTLELNNVVLNLERELKERDGTIRSQRDTIKSQGEAIEDKDGQLGEFDKQRKKATEKNDALKRECERMGEEIDDLNRQREALTDDQVAAAVEISSALETFLQPIKQAKGIDLNRLAILAKNGDPDAIKLISDLFDSSRRQTLDKLQLWDEERVRRSFRLPAKDGK